MGPSGSLIKGCGCTGTWAWSLACRAVPFPRAVANLPGRELPSEQDTDTAQALCLKGHIYSSSKSRNILKAQAALSQPGRVCCPVNLGEPPWAHRTLGLRTHPSITDSPTWPSHHQAVLSHKPAPSHSLLASVHDKSQQSVDHIWMVTADEGGRGPQLTMNQEKCVYWTNFCLYKNCLCSPT